MLVGFARSSALVPTPAITRNGDFCPYRVSAGVIVFRGRVDEGTGRRDTGGDWAEIRRWDSAGRWAGNYGRAFILQPALAPFWVKAVSENEQSFPPRRIQPIDEGGCLKRFRFLRRSQAGCSLLRPPIARLRQAMLVQHRTLDTVHQRTNLPDKAQGRLKLHRHDQLEGKPQQIQSA